MGRAFEYRKATKLKRWGHMARTFTKIGKQIAIAVKAGGPDPDNNPHLRSIILNANAGCCQGPDRRPLTTTRICVQSS